MDTEKLREKHHLIEAFVWVALAIPTILWWKESVLWVAMMSIYANAKVAVSAHGARKAQGGE